MSNNLTVNDAARKVTLDTDQSLLATHNYVISLLRALDGFKAVAVDVSKVELKRQGNSTSYDYSISAPGRSWSQVIRIPVGAEADMNFDVPDFWRLSEFSKQRDIRDLLILLVRDFGLSHAKVDWN